MERDSLSDTVLDWHLAGDSTPDDRAAIDGLLAADAEARREVDVLRRVVTAAPAWTPVSAERLEMVRGIARNSDVTVASRRRQASSRWLWRMGVGAVGVSMAAGLMSVLPNVAKRLAGTASGYRTAPYRYATNAGNGP